MKAFCAFQNISGMSEYIFPFLARLIRHFCKKSKCCDIDKIIPIKQTDIARKRFSYDGRLCRFFHILRYSKRRSKIVRASGRYVSQWNFCFALHHSGYHFVQCTISTAAHNKIIISGIRFHFFFCISCTLRRIYRNLIIRFYHGVHDV